MKTTHEHLLYKTPRKLALSMALIEIYTSPDNNNWSLADSRTVSRNEVVDVTLNPTVQARYVELLWADSVGGSTDWNGWGAIYEFQVFGP